MKKKHLIITIAVLSILSLSGCHKDKPVESQAPLETIQPDTTSETISDKLDEAPALSIEEAPGALPDDAISTQIDIESNNVESESTSRDNSETDSNELDGSKSELENSSSESENESLSVKTETISESEAQAILESEVAVRESAQDNASDWVKQNQEMESMANDYYSKQLEEQMADKELMDSLNPYK